jgi:DNA-binding response OmpR family regulator
MRVLIADESAAATDLARRLRQEGHLVRIRPAARDLPDAVLAATHHLLILRGTLLPFSEVLEICRTVHREAATLILLLGPGWHVQQCTQALEAGADDCISLVEPGNLDDVIARVHALLRRHPLSLAGNEVQGAPRRIRVTETLWLNLAQRLLVSRTREVVPLTEYEFKLLAYLVHHEGTVLRREAILQNVWGQNHEGSWREVDVYISYLRQKLEPDPKRPRYILTAWGRGYLYRPPTTARAARDTPASTGRQTRTPAHSTAAPTTGTYRKSRRIA